jgi:hypothetical protein
MLYDILYIALILLAAILAFLLGRKLAGRADTQTKTTTSLIRSIQAIAELAVLEYVTEGVAEIKQKKTNLITVRWKRGLLRYTAKLKVGFDLERLDYNIDDEGKSIRIALPTPKILSCEIYNRKFYKLPLEKAENVPWKVDIIQDFSSDEVLALDDEARDSALKNVNEFYVLDLLRDKTKLAFKKIFSLSHPDYATEIAILSDETTQPQAALPPEATALEQSPDKQK